MLMNLEQVFLGSSKDLKERASSQLAYLSKLTDLEMKEILATADAKSIRELNQLLKDLQDWRDRRPIDFYEPAGIPQENFHKSKKTLRVLLGSNNSAKTSTGGVEAIWFATGKHPYRGKIDPCHGWVTSVDFATSKFVVEKKFFEWCPKEEIKSWYEKDRLVELYNGSTIQFKSADSGREKFQGQRIRWNWIDEEVSYEIFQEIQARQMANQPLDTWMTLTPLLGLTWVYTEVFEKWEEYENSKVKGAA